MSESRKKLNLDTALAEWPHVEKPAEEWDERARSVMDRLRRGERGATAAYVSDDELFGAPLGPSADEGRASRERDRRGFQELAQELAKMAAMTPTPVAVAPESTKQRASERIGEAKGEDSGLIHLAAPVEPAKSNVVPLPPPKPKAETAPQPQPQVQARVVERTEKKKGSALGILIGGVFALSAAAAGTFLYLQLNKQPVTVATMTQPTVVATEAPPAPPRVTPTPSEPAIDPNALPEAQPTVAIAPKPSTHHATGSSAVALAPKEPPKEAPAKVAEKDLPSAPPGATNALGEEMRKSVGATNTPEVRPAAAPSGQNAANGSVPTKPSQGAVAGAIGAVLPGARECLGPDDPISRASIVFASDGTVQSVAVTGAAAGKPTEACIKSALMKAKLPPFAEPSYTAPITIRHK